MISLTPASQGVAARNDVALITYSHTQVGVLSLRGNRDLPDTLECGGQVHRLGMLFLAVMLAGCASSSDKLNQLVGTKIDTYISTRHVYPDSILDLPGGGKVYRFTDGTGGRVLANGVVRSNVCAWWLEANSEGTIVHWRYDNC